MNAAQKHVAVLMGGWSSEREVSLVSGRACAAALREAGFRVTEIDVGRDIAVVLAALKPEVVFNALHGRFGEDGRIQGLLDIMGIPYTHSGAAASAIAMDKVQTKHVCASVGVPMAKGKVVRREHAFDAMPAPFVVKPIAEGSSVGVRIVKNGDNFAPDSEWHYGDDVLVEEYVPGRELTVGVMGDRALDVTEIKPKEAFFDYTAKYTEGRAVHMVPAPVPASIYEEALKVALLAHQTVGCRGVTRSDFRYDDTRSDPGRLVFLEINTQPGMTPLSLVPEQAAHHGISFKELVTWMVEEARCDS